MVDFHSLRLSTNWEHVKYWSSVFFCMQNSICHMFCVPFYILLFLFNCFKFPALKRFRFLTQMFVSCIWRPSEETRISNLPPGFFRIFFRFLSSISRFHAEGSCRVNCSSPRSSWLSAKTRNYIQKLILTMTLVHFCLCEVLARQKQVLKKFRPKIPIDFLLDPAKAVRWNGSGEGG